MAIELAQGHFKATDRNGFVPTNSCHHPQWLGAVPKGQYMRIRRNCDNISDFHTQRYLLRFCEKGYSLEDLTKTKNQVLSMDRESLLIPKDKPLFQGDLAFVSGFHRQYRNVEYFFFFLNIGLYFSKTKICKPLFLRNQNSFTGEHQD